VRSADDAHAYTDSLKRSTERRKSWISPFDLSPAYRRSKVLVVAGAVVIPTVVTLMALHAQELTPNMLYVGLASCAAGVALAVAGLLRQRTIRQQDLRLPKLEDKHVQYASKFVNVLGPSHGTNSAIWAGLTGALEGGAAGMAIGSGLQGNVPMALQFCGAFALAAFLTWLVARTGEAFGLRVRRMRARQLVRNLKRIDLKKYPHLAEDIKFLEEEAFKSLCEQSYRATKLIDWLMLALLLAVPPVLFAAALAVRLLAPDQTGNMAPVIGLSSLACLCAWGGFAIGASGHLLPMEAPIWTYVSRRFPSAQAFREWRMQLFAELEDWANSCAKEVDTRLAKWREDADDRTIDADVRVEVPFPLKGTIPPAPTAPAIDAQLSTDSSDSASPALRIVEVAA
jgi:hypothetical protein